MKISVILSTYGRAASALDCIESIFSNDYSDFELLVIDQGPGKMLEDEIKARYQGVANIRYFFLDPPGLSRARNLGLQQAKGDIVAYIDDDALADGNWLAGIAATFSDREPCPALMGGRILPIWPGARPRWLPVEREVLLGLYDIGDYEKPFPGEDLPIGANMAGVRQIIVEMGGFSEHLGADSSRPRAPMAGEESMLAQQVKNAGHLIYYQPKATVYHKISKTKLNRRFFLRRHFWEGITVVTRMKLVGSITRESSAGITKYHLRSIARSVLRLVTPMNTQKPKTPRSALAMGELTQIAYSAGVLYGIRRPVAERPRSFRPAAR